MPKYTYLEPAIRLLASVDRVFDGARRRGVRAHTVSLKLRYADFKTITRARTVSPTNSEVEIYPVIKDLYDAARTRRLRVRLLGVTLTNLGFFDEQIELFAPDKRRIEAVDAIREKYGYDAVGLAGGRKYAGRQRAADTAAGKRRPSSDSNS